MLKLDDRDLAILRVLSTEGRISNAALAERIGLSASPCWERVKRLEKAGVIEGYSAQINLKKLSSHVTVFVTVELDDHTAEAFEKFEKAALDYSEIVSCWALGGGFDYILQIVTRDIESYQMLIDEMLVKKIGLARYFTYVVTKPVKASGAPPFGDLLPE